jgi:hypothetical protein
MFLCFLHITMDTETRLLLMANLVSHISLPDNPKTTNLNICTNKPRIAKCDGASKPQKSMYMCILTKAKLLNIHTVYAHTIWQAFIYKYMHVYIHLWVKNKFIQEHESKFKK